VVQYKSGTRYLCNALRQQYGVPVCQYIPADPVEAKVIEAFFAARSPAELDAYARALSVQQQTEAATERARTQQLQRLRYQTALAQRQFEQVDPANRLVAAELERRWESALRDVQHAEEAVEQRTPRHPSVAELPAELCDALTTLGPKLPALGSTTLLSQAQKKALLRCLLDTVVLHRVGRDQIHTRIVWRGGETTEFEIPVTVHALAALSSGQELEQRILALHAQGKTDGEIAQELTAAGFRSPKAHRVLENTVKLLRLKHRQFVTRHQSHPRHIPGVLTVPQLARALELSVHWFYDRLNAGRIHLQKDPGTKLYLFPDQPTTLERLKALRDGHLDNVRF
jgi:hypothetical protein